MSTKKYYVSSDILFKSREIAHLVSLMFVETEIKTVTRIQKLGGCCHHYDESTDGSAKHFLINEMG